MTKKRSDQQGLFAEAIFDPDKLKLRARSLTLDQIARPQEEVRGSAAFKGSVERYGGIFEPIVVQWDERRKLYVVVEGRRRYFALLDLVSEGTFDGAATRLPASEIIGLPVDLPVNVVQACVSLLLNHLRGDNVVADAANVETLMRAGATEHDLKKFAGLDDQAIKGLVKVTKLIEPLKAAMNEGRISQTVVKSVAKLRPAQQEQLAKMLAERIAAAGDEKAKAAVKLTLEDVRTVKSVVTAEAAQALPQSLFEGDAGVETDESNPLRYHVEQLRRLEASLPKSAPKDVRERFKSLLDSMRFQPTPA
jgi:hypothetical protein